jgi:hypothetical protein
LPTASVRRCWPPLLHEQQPHPSPDGRWIAYLANDSGREEVYLMPTAGGDRMQVSTTGGVSQRWGAGGREILYLAPGQSLMSVAVDWRAGQPVLGAPRLLFKLPSAYNFDVTADGAHVLAREVVASSRLQVVAGWPRLLAGH